MIPISISFCAGFKSLVGFNISGTVDVAQVPRKVDLREYDWDFDQGLPLRRQEPLPRMTTLSLPFVKCRIGYTAAFLYPNFKHCPALKKRILPPMISKMAIHEVAKVLGDRFPNIVHLSLPAPSCTSNGEAMMRIMEKASGPRPEAIFIEKFFDRTPSTLSVAAIARHSSTLRHIYLSQSEGFNSATLQASLYPAEPSRS
ncbi:hypothetical protein BGX30_015202 [Mortierella sp. GBA39]|nr:hypothetical protein BGX30_015202 [Mortierella sp. GBA39]